MKITKKGMLTYGTLILLSVLAFISRLWAVIRFESIIHEYDPYFNFRATQQLINKGFFSFYNWFDESVWYPLGRTVGFTVYPGLMWTTGVVYKILEFFHIFVSIRDVCVFLAPLFAVFTVWVTYGIGKEIKGGGAGLLGAAFVSIIPGYISRSVAGSFDNECVSIFALLFVFYCWIKAIKSGSMVWSAVAALAYFYMAAAWGAYIFVINIIPIHVITLIISGRFSNRLYVSYSIFYMVGVLLSMQVRFIGFQPVKNSEQMLALLTFVFVQGYALFTHVKKTLSEESFKKLIRIIGTAVVAGLVGTVALALATNRIVPWTGRFYALLDPTYAKNHIPIIASVSEHQPTTWASFFFDLYFLIIVFPVGIYMLFNKPTDERIFIMMYSIASCYFAGVMVRLMLVLAPAVCIVGGYAVSEILSRVFGVVMAEEKEGRKRKRAVKNPNAKPIAIGVGAIVTLMLIMYMRHCIWVGSEAYSSPSIVLAARGHDGSRIIFDDFREAYSWISHNTKPDAKIMSWWDYGYQITEMANRTTIVDNNTWNNTHIATVGRAMSSPEAVGYKISQDLDVDYVLVIFGGLSGYSSDDINKFLWMVRIGGLDELDSLYPPIKESDYYTPRGEFRVDSEGAPKLLNSLMYKLCYYRFGEVQTDQRSPTGFDRVRNVEIGNKNFELEYFEEAFTSEHWIVRVYKVLPPANH
ncbi:hypothetical protein PCE1_001622 [Barthelona sp. PCE]